MRIFQPKDIVIARFPYYDPAQVPCSTCGKITLEMAKTRPVLIVKRVPGNFYWCVMISSKTTSQFSEGSYLLSKGELTLDMVKASFVRANILMTINDNVILKKYCSVKDEAYERILDILNRIKW